MAKNKKSKYGSVYARTTGRYAYYVKLPGDTKYRTYALKAPGQKFATKDKKIAEELARFMYEKALLKSKGRYVDVNTIGQLVDSYISHLKEFFQNGSDRPQQATYALNTLKKQFGNIPIDEFEIYHFDEYRLKLVQYGLAVKTVNDRCALVKAMCDWAAQKQVLSKSVAYGIRVIKPLKEGNYGVKASKKIKPIPIQWIAATCRHTTPVVAAMIKLHFYGAMRSTDVCTIRPCDIDQKSLKNDELWVYYPPFHNEQSKGNKHRVLLGKRAQKILMPFLLRPKTTFCFTPEQSQNQRSKQTDKEYNNRYNKDSYRRAVLYAIAAANKDREQRAKQSGVNIDKIGHWTPHQLRHTMATILREKEGLDATQSVLDHTSLEATQIYAERNEKVGRAAARKHG